MLDHLTNCLILVMQPSASGGGGAAMGFKGRKFGVSRPTKFQPVGGKGKKTVGKGIKNNK